MREVTTIIPNPGSHEACARLGCRCDPFANQFGRGLGESTSGVPVFEIHPACEIHRAGGGWSPAADVVLKRKRTDQRAALPMQEAPPKGKPGRKPKPRVFARCPGLPGEPCGKIRALRRDGRCDTCHNRQWQRDKTARKRAEAAKGAAAA